MTMLEELHKSFFKKDENKNFLKLDENDINAISEKVFAKLTETQKEEPKKEEPKKDDETEEI